MNKIIKSIYEQIEPDKRTVDELTERLKGEKADEVRGGFKPMRFILPTAVVCAAVCAAVFLNIGKDKLPDDSSSRGKTDNAVTVTSSRRSEPPVSETEAGGDTEEISSNNVSESVTASVAEESSPEETVCGKKRYPDEDTEQGGGTVTTIVSEADRSEISDNGSQPTETESAPEEGDETVDSAEYSVDKIYGGENEYIRPEIALVISETYKRNILEKADKITFGGRTYYLKGETLDFGSQGKPLGEGTLTVDGDMVYSIYIYEAEEGSEEIRIAVDIGDWKPAVYEVADDPAAGGELEETK